jgi:hypothetical protein
MMQHDQLRGDSLEQVDEAEGRIGRKIGRTGKLKGSHEGRCYCCWRHFTRCRQASLALPVLGGREWRQ